ncbi:MAG TPA: competence/damage-inducible protein A [Candidatus Binatia bacterium]|nr:competence/damage-inducible protein A [Candidatus Binatia bacterium]
MAARTAGIVVIGNEILSGKVADTNSPWLAHELRQLGVELRRITTIPDELDVIADTVREFSRAFDHVFTSGGVGPTHDDVTMEGIARGFDMRVIRHPELEEGLRRFLKDNVNEAHLKMAEVPEGAELLHDPALGFPTIKLANVYILPGIPEILRKKFEALRERFVEEPYYLRVIYTRHSESMIAASLHQALAEFPDLLLGSYPKIGDAEYLVKLTMESKDVDYVQRAFDRLVALLPAGSIVRTE